MVSLEEHPSPSWAVQPVILVSMLAQYNSEQSVWLGF